MLRVLRVWLVALVLLSGCVGLSATRNGPARDVRRSAYTRTSTSADGRTASYRQDPSIHDAERPLGYGLVGKTGYASVSLGEGSSHGGIALDSFAHVTLAFGKVSASVQTGAWMTISESELDKSVLAMAVPIELELGWRPLDRLALTVAGGRSLWGFVSVPVSDQDAETVHMGLWRARAGGLVTLRHGSYSAWEITMRLEGFVSAGSGSAGGGGAVPAFDVDYRALGALFTFEFIGTTSMY
jgi:hypothetical protein